MSLSFQQLQKIHARVRETLATVREESIQQLHESGVDEPTEDQIKKLVDEKMVVAGAQFSHDLETGTFDLGTNEGESLPARLLPFTAKLGLMAVQIKLRKMVTGE
jgi:hypothetical protein